MTTTTKVQKVSIALLAAGALTIAACGSGQSDVVETTVAPTETITPDTTGATTSTEAPAAQDIVSIAASNANFSTLVAAVQAAGLVETLQGGGPFTVFAPTNEAFAALPAGLVEKLLLPENVDVLRSILTYHVVIGAVTSDNINTGKVATVQGEDIDVLRDEMTGAVSVNKASVVIADIVASNGVIHAIDSVILPPALDISSL